MLFREIIAMALSSLGANKLRAALTMMGITIGVFSIISVMTAIGALQSSIETGISFLGSNIFQFAKYPVNIDAGGEIKKKYQTPSSGQIGAFSRRMLTRSVMAAI